jgi:hypothetical protein
MYLFTVIALMKYLHFLLISGMQEEQERRCGVRAELWAEDRGG